MHTEKSKEKELKWLNIERHLSIGIELLYNHALQKLLECCGLIFRKLSLYPLHHWCNISVIAWVLNNFSIFLYVSFATSPAPADNSQLNPVAPACPFVTNLQRTKVNSSDKTIYCFYLKYVVTTAVAQWDLLQCECCWW